MYDASVRGSTHCTCFRWRCEFENTIFQAADMTLHPDPELYQRMFATDPTTAEIREETWQTYSLKRQHFVDFFLRFKPLLGQPGLRLGSSFRTMVALPSDVQICQQKLLDTPHADLPPFCRPSKSLEYSGRERCGTTKLQPSAQGAYRSWLEFHV